MFELFTRLWSYFLWCGINLKPPKQWIASSTEVQLCKVTAGYFSLTSLLTASEKTQTIAMFMSWLRMQAKDFLMAFTLTCSKLLSQSCYFPLELAAQASSL